jgi:cytochrome b561
MKEEKNAHLSSHEQAMEAFVNHLTFYVIVMAIVWLGWLLTNTPDKTPWQIYPTVVWGAGLFTNYLYAHRPGKGKGEHYENLNAG